MKNARQTIIVLALSLISVRAIAGGTGKVPARRSEVIAMQSVNDRAWQWNQEYKALMDRKTVLDADAAQITSEIATRMLATGIAEVGTNEVLQWEAPTQDAPNGRFYFAAPK